jgi:hypothetical protein
MLTKLFCAYETGIELTVYLHLPDAACNQVRILRTKIEDGHLGPVFVDVARDEAQHIVRVM